MKLLKSKRFRALLLALFFVALYMRHIYSAEQEFYSMDYEKTDISEIVRKKALSEKDYDIIFDNTGVSPSASRELIEEKKLSTLEELNDLYFEKPLIKKEFIAFPVTVGELNKGRKTPLVNLKKGDVLVTYNTHTLDWRHGHCGLVMDAERGTLLEHMSIGYKSCLTYVSNWEKYPSFVVLRCPDEKIAEKAVYYAKNNLIGATYNILAGVIRKDKTGEDMPISSHCSHIIWQAYKAAGIDIDKTGGIFVTPENLAMSDKLEVIQIYGLNPKYYKDRLSK